MTDSRQHVALFSSLGAIFPFHNPEMSLLIERGTDQFTETPSEEVYNRTSPASF
jgi:hypothetical protein